MLRLAPVLCALTLAAATARAESPQASGTFESRNWNVKFKGAYAFPSEVGMDHTPGIRVALSNAAFLPEVVDRYYDREHAINTFFADDETKVVYFDFEPGGKYAGMTYYFESGDGCGYCFDGSVVSTVKVSKGRIAGKLRLAPKPDEVSFDLEFDVPLAAADHGTPLPAGFGEPGKAYAGFSTALAAGTAEALKPYLTDKDRADLAEHGPQLISYFTESHPTKSYKIKKGWVKAERALLLVEGETSYSNVKTEVHLVREGNTWRVDNQILQVRIGE